MNHSNLSRSSTFAFASAAAPSIDVPTSFSSSMRSCSTVRHFCAYERSTDNTITTFYLIVIKLSASPLRSINKAVITPGLVVILLVVKVRLDHAGCQRIFNLSTVLSAFTDSPISAPPIEPHQEQSPSLTAGLSFSRLFLCFSNHLA